jgi:hypothetical protein
MIVKALVILAAWWLIIADSPRLQALPENDPRINRLQKRAEKRLKNAGDVFYDFRKLGKMDVDSIKVQRHNEPIIVYLNPNVTHLPIRENFIAELENHFKNRLGRRFRHYELEFYSRGRLLHEYIPNYFRSENLPADHSRIRQRPAVKPLVNLTSGYEAGKGLLGNHIALWHSHGNYYNVTLDRWQWQRARLFTTVEDVFPTEYVLRFITPMLENAGATVLLPRERDFQTFEVIVDNDASTGDSEVVIHHGNTHWLTRPVGFAMKDTLFDGENPFRMGSHLVASSNAGASLIYVPNIPGNGEYAVYFSWHYDDELLDDVPVTVQYSGGSASFVINQQMGYNTWICLGTFPFISGKNPAEGSVTLHTHSSREGKITADAVRFGGGMGNVARHPVPEAIANRRSADDRGSSLTQPTGGSLYFNEFSLKTSGRPRYTEGARYWLQYAGMPDTLVYSFNEGRNDYNDDFMSRGEWVNYLMGAPLGPQRDRKVRGLNIPVDLSLAFHTDAGITTGDTVIGTLAIYSAEREKGLFPDGVSKLASRDLTDLVQSSIVRDIQALYKPDWTRRAIWDRQYSEAWRPNVPALLLELLSHQNLADMRFGLDPQFQFDVSRAIYKGILQFIATNEGRNAVVQPLPPQTFNMEKTGEKSIRLSWQATPDPLEPTAAPDAYIFYTRCEGSGFDQGTLVNDTFVEIELPQWNTVYSYKITAVNSGGESFPSEILSAAFVPGAKNVLVVNGFQKISGPGIFDRELMEGLDWWDNHAIPYKSSVSFTGQQYDFDRQSPWLDDDSPGWGASYADYEGRVMAGNTFDFPFIHGQAIRNAGYSFISAGRSAFECGMHNPEEYFAINLIMGKQKGTPALVNPDSIRFRVFSPAMMEKMTKYSAFGGNILITGAYIGTDSRIFNDQTAINFTQNILGYSWRTGRATNIGQIRATDMGSRMFLPEIEFAAQANETIYHVEAPDAIEPAGAGSRAVFRYRTTASGAAVIHRSGHKVFAMGIPFETITSESQRNDLMKGIMRFFEEE